MNSTEDPVVTAISKHAGKGINYGTLARLCIVRGSVLAALWWLLTAGDTTSWAIGAPIILLLLTVSIRKARQTPMRWRLSAVLIFVPFFVWKSILGAIDVARRVYQPQMPLAPVMVDYQIGLSKEPARVLFANAVSLLPGTLSAELQDRRLVVHALDGTQNVTEDLAILEKKVADLFVG